jgi:hypothetical protein
MVIALDLQTRELEELYEERLQSERELRSRSVEEIAGLRGEFNTTLSSLVEDADGEIARTKAMYVLSVSPRILLRSS